ncbi:MAG TPA: MarR family transcriptional regulator [Lachnospiraceae bacterium]|nr:MarR family transcriptional regulator [Lachnospiraceae bacterium]
MEQTLATLVNILWKECIRNLNTHLTEQEAARFSNNDYYYLMVIDSLKEPNFSEIAQALSVTKPAVSAIVRKLSSMDIVVKVQSEEDKRVFFVKITEKGYGILNGDYELYKGLTSMVEQIVNDEKELNIIKNTLEKLVKILEVDGVDSIRK